MHDATQDLNLTFPSIPVGKNETPLDLTRLLYKGGASVRRNWAKHAIQEGLLGGILPERVDLVLLVHEAIAAKLASGGSSHTARTQIQLLEKFFAWTDKTEEVLLSVAGLKEAYLRWAEHLLYRNKVLKDQSDYTVYTVARCVGQILDSVLGRPTPMIELTKIREPRRRRAPVGAAADKQHLQGTFAFGNLLQDICDGLALKVVWGARPVRIPIRTGGSIVLWMGLRIRDAEQQARQTLKNSLKAEARNAAYDNDPRLSRRADLVNMRVLAEMLMFIGQTGMNLAQANTLKLRHFSYSSDIEGYKVREYKARRGGEVLFEIFKEYRGHFERYLEWRRSLFPNCAEVFPLMRRGAHASHRPCFELIQNACKQAGVPWISPSILRGTRVNWLLRRSGDADLTAELAQHHKKTLIQIYEVPSQQRAFTEVTRFWQDADPVLAGHGKTRAVAPGSCDGVPAMSFGKPESAPSPDCIRPSGCLWCEHHRDIDSFDYVWAMSCFWHLKVIELSKYCPQVGAPLAAHPAEQGIRRLRDKLAWFRDSNSARRAWVEEALTRIEEGYFHGEWAHLIQAIESP